MVLYDELGKELGIDWKDTNYKEFVRGMKVEGEHNDITKGNRQMTAKIVMAHLKEIPDYYTRLEHMEEMAKMVLNHKANER
jgi:hypothetical protein